MAMTVRVPASWGEVIDKITILELKSRHLASGAKRANVLKELQLLQAARDERFAGHARLGELADALKSINDKLWQIEDDVRDCERRQDFGPRFVDLARAVYFTNDERAALKREINELLGSELVEEKLYAAY